MCIFNILSDCVSDPELLRRFYFSLEVVVHMGFTACNENRDFLI